MPDYTPNAGQTYIPFQENTQVDTLPYTPLPKPEPPFAPLELNERFSDRAEITSQGQHFIAGVTAEMLDWFWANMEKCYFLWAPGSHKRFNWVKAPWQVGFVQSVHCISEAVGKGNPVFGGSGVEIHRQGLDYFPFTTHLSHVICEGIYNDLGEWVDSTIHMWENVPGGCVHITAAVANKNLSMPPHFILEMLEENPEQKIVAPGSTDHCEYECAMWPRFLPTLYGLWKDHPDPTQSVRCDLTVAENADGTLRYVKENGPVSLG